MFIKLIEQVIDNKVGSELLYSKVYAFKSGIFDPIKQEIQGISLKDGLVLNGIKIYSVGGLKYTLIPPGTQIIVGYVNSDQGMPYLVGIDPNAQVIVSFQGMINGIINSAVSPITTGSPITIIPNPAIP
jgi:hypothetical protein